MKRIELRKIISKSLQGVLGVISSILFTISFPYFGWNFVINVTKAFENIGFSIDLVGRPGTYDPGAVIVSGLYLLTILLASYLTIKKTKYKLYGKIILFSGILMTIMVFVLVSSMIWF
ncbi:hypothetical protein Curi_c13610 [Gottschalkia acidurici 9a]|uniref:Uncharacterized protein n=1 Tax=Gottschalkia acidurici (strain ATCC 7906 / DSM 604 / BCRC 14475 / CIP 104303 / KCTC 5404 / NCIMB 10678 / 9a) TaxID=1128398 RepID=K0B158_GOTA9|nr:hypothetical protein [Gottschalkia acidurici]AFS78371.1 hypothetical protein Curi_c13610 [Gottschalkia acidurici 9a]